MPATILHFAQSEEPAYIPVRTTIFKPGEPVVLPQVGDSYLNEHGVFEVKRRVFRCAEDGDLVIRIEYGEGDDS